MVEHLSEESETPDREELRKRLYDQLEGLPEDILKKLVLGLTSYLVVSRELGNLLVEMAMERKKDAYAKEEMEIAHEWLSTTGTEFLDKYGCE